MGWALGGLPPPPELAATPETPSAPTMHGMSAQPVLGGNSQIFLRSEEEDGRTGYNGQGSTGHPHHLPSLTQIHSNSKTAHLSCPARSPTAIWWSSGEMAIDLIPEVAVLWPCCCCCCRWLVARFVLLSHRAEVRGARAIEGLLGAERFRRLPPMPPPPPWPKYVGPKPSMEKRQVK